MEPYPVHTVPLEELDCAKRPTWVRAYCIRHGAKSWRPQSERVHVCIQRNSLLFTSLPVLEQIEETCSLRYFLFSSREGGWACISSWELVLKCLCFFPLSTAKPGLYLKEMLPRFYTYLAWMWLSLRWELYNVDFIQATPPCNISSPLDFLAEITYHLEDKNREVNVVFFFW